MDSSDRLSGIYVRRIEVYETYGISDCVLY
jgi:hypothetical protein